MQNGFPSSHLTLRILFPRTRHPELAWTPSYVCCRRGDPKWRCVAGFGPRNSLTCMLYSRSEPSWTPSAPNGRVGMSTASASRRTRGPSSDPQARLPRRLGCFSPFVTRPTGGCGVTWLCWGGGGRESAAAERRERESCYTTRRRMTVSFDRGQGHSAAGDRRMDRHLKETTPGPPSFEPFQGPARGKLVHAPSSVPHSGDRRPLPPRSPLSSVYLLVYYPGAVRCMQPVKWPISPTGAGQVNAPGTAL